MTKPLQEWRGLFYSSKSTNVTLPKLDSKFHQHIEYTYVEGKMMRVMRPFTNGPYFLMPMQSLEEELQKDQLPCKPAPFPSINDCEDPNDLRDHYLNKINFNHDL